MPFESSAVIGGMRLSRVAGIVGIAIYATVAIGFIAYDIYKVRTRHRRWTRAMGLRRTSYRFCKPLSQRPRTPSTPSNHKTHKKSVPPAVTYAQTYRPRPTRNRVENRVDQATGKEDKEKTKDAQASEGIHGRDEEKKPDNIRVADTGSGLPDRVEVPAPLQDGSASCARVGLSPIEEVSEKEPSSSSEKLLAVNIVDTGLSASASAAPKFEPDVESSAPSHSPCQDDGDVLVPTSSHSDHTQNEAEAEANMGSPIVDNDQWLPPSSPSTFLNFTGLMSSPSTTIDQSDNAESDMDDAGSDSDHLTMSSLWSPVGAPSAVLSLSDITSRAGSTVDSDSDSEDFDLLSPRSEYFSPTNSSSDLL